MLCCFEIVALLGVIALEMNSRERPDEPALSHQLLFSGGTRALDIIGEDVAAVGLVERRVIPIGQCFLGQVFPHVGSVIGQFSGPGRTRHRQQKREEADGPPSRPANIKRLLEQGCGFHRAKRSISLTGLQDRFGAQNKRFQIVTAESAGSLPTGEA